MRLPLALALVVAGCVGPSVVAPPDAAGPAPVPDFDFSAVLVADHDHADASLHDAAYAMTLVGHLDPAGGGLSGANTEVTIHQGYAYVANQASERAMTIVDVRDPADMRIVSQFAPPGIAGSYWDVSVTDDGDLAILSAQASGGGAPGAAGGVLLVNVEDKTRPFLESFTPFADQGALIPAGVHNANPFVVGGKTYVAATTANGMTHLMAVEGSAPARTLRKLAVVDGMHDSAVQVHPLTGRTLLYSSAGGVWIWDVSDPARPLQVSFTADSSELETYHETLPSDVLVDGRHYTLAATESMGPPTPFTLLDTTDPAEPFVVGQWKLPGAERLGDQRGLYRFSGHNVAFQDGRLHIAHYHAGVWVVDATTPERVREPVALGFYLPHENVPAVPRSLTLRDVPAVWSVRYAEGIVWAIDANTGLYALRHDGAPSQHAAAPHYPSNIR